jgi:hypothetical protein
MWKTKETEVKGRKVVSMICQNSDLEKSRWAEFAPEEGPCENWTIVTPEATSSLCSECVQRSVNIRISNQ